MGTMVGPGSKHSSASISSHLTPDASNVVLASLDARTRLTYWRVWCRLKTYCHEHGLNTQLPIPVILLLNFLTSLLQIGYQPSTIASYVSALAFIHKFFGYADPTCSFLVRQFLNGSRKLHGTAVDMRLPITTQILNKIICAIPTVIMIDSHRSLLKAVFLLCFNAFLRMGELCIEAGFSPDLVIQRQDISFSYEAGKVTGVSLLLRHFENNLQQLPVTLVLPLNSVNAQYCPVSALLNYCTEYLHV